VPQVDAYWLNIDIIEVVGKTKLTNTFSFVEEHYLDTSPGLCVNGKAKQNILAKRSKKCWQSF
jgi:hypothetical protein